MRIVWSPKASAAQSREMASNMWRRTKHFNRDSTACGRHLRLKPVIGESLCDARLLHAAERVIMHQGLQSVLDPMQPLQPCSPFA
jgi:hypothetical protein